MAALPNIGMEKRRAVLSNYKADVYDAWQLWLERNEIKRNCFSFSICSLVCHLHEFKVAPSPNCGAKFIYRFSPLKM